MASPVTPSTTPLVNDQVQNRAMLHCKSHPREPERDSADKKACLQIARKFIYVNVAAKHYSRFQCTREIVQGKTLMAKIDCNGTLMPGATIPWSARVKEFELKRVPLAQLKKTANKELARFKEDVELLKKKVGRCDLDIEKLDYKDIGPIAPNDQALIKALKTRGEAELAKQVEQLANSYNKHTAFLKLCRLARRI